MAALAAVPEKEVAEFRDELDEMFGKNNKYRKSSKQLLEKLAPPSPTPIPHFGSNLSQAPAPEIQIAKDFTLPDNTGTAEIEILPTFDSSFNTMSRERSRSAESDSSQKKLSWKQKLSFKFWTPKSQSTQQPDLNLVQFVDKEREKEALEILFTRYSYGGTMMKSNGSTTCPNKHKKARRKSSSDSMALFADELKQLAASSQ
jgi:hypothetical protein